MFDKLKLQLKNNYEKESEILKDFVSKPLFDNRILQKDASYPKISIITPSYNQAQFLERSILSVLNQNYPNLEYIIIDGGSTDGSVDIIRQYEKYLAYRISEPDRGQSHALNKGFEIATGEIFGWLNSDDLYMPDAFNIACKALKDHPLIKIVFGDYFNIDAEDKFICKEYAFDFSRFHFLYEGFHLNAQSMFWRKDIHQRFGKFDEHLYRTMDYDMILRFGLQEKDKTFLRIPVPLGCFRRHEQQKTKGFDKIVEEEHRLIAQKNNCKLKFTTLGRLLRLLFRLRRAYWYLKRGGIDYLMIKALPTFFHK